MNQQQHIEAQMHQHNITIAQAVLDYKAKAACPSQPLRDMVEALIKEGKSLILKNDSYAEALEYTEAMLWNTHKSINIVTGQGCGSFYANLLRHLTDALKRVQDAMGSARMVVLGTDYPEWLVALAHEFAGTLTLAQVKTEKDRQHFIVCDSIIVREEEPHGEIGPESPADAIKATVMFNEAEKGREFEARFEDVWSMSEICDLDLTQKPKALSWIIQRMEALRHQPPPTFDKVDSQMSAAIATRKRSTDKANP